MSGAPFSRPPPECLATAMRMLFPMQLRVGDRFTDEAGDWEVAGRPESLQEGKVIRVRVVKVGAPDGAAEKTWPAWERITVIRPARRASRAAR